MKVFKIDYTVTEKKVENKTRIIRAESGLTAHDVFNDLIPKNDGKDYDVKVVTELNYRCLTCETHGEGMHGIECPTRKQPRRKAFASGKRMNSPEVITVMQTIRQLSDADARGRMSKLPLIAMLLSVQNLTKIMETHEGVK